MKAIWSDFLVKKFLSKVIKIRSSPRQTKSLPKHLPLFFSNKIFCTCTKFHSFPSLKSLGLQFYRFPIFITSLNIIVFFIPTFIYFVAFHLFGCFCITSKPQFTWLFVLWWLLWLWVCGGTLLEKVKESGKKRKSGAVIMMIK